MINKLEQSDIELKQVTPKVFRVLKKVEGEYMTTIGINATDAISSFGRLHACSL